MKVQSKEKLFKDLEKVMTAYEHLISDIDSMVELHHIHSLGTLGKDKTWEQVNQEIQAFLQPIRQVAATPDLLASQENLVKFVVMPVWICTKMASLFNQVTIKRENLILKALECMHRLREDTPLISPIATDYRAWQNFLKEKQVDVPDLAITHTLP